MSAGSVISETLQIVRVPDLPWCELVTSAARKLGRARVHPLLVKEDLFRGERGRVYEALVWKPGTVIHGAKVRAHFKDLGFQGNLAAFVAWAMSSEIAASCERCVTITDDQSHFSLRGIEDLAPCLLRGFHASGYGCSLTLSRVLKPMHTHWTFVAFREAEAPQPG
jgi:hypothetical protein